MNTIVQTLNTTGRAFVGLAAPMLIQAGLLILILLAVDALLRKRVRAVFRYWIWMLVLVKLVLPPSLWSPVSLGTWFGDKLEVSATALLAAPESSPVESPPAELSPAVSTILSPPQRMFVDPPRPEPMAVPPSPLPTETADRATPVTPPPAVSLNWQGLVLLIWLAVVTALLLLLAQRTFFVQGLVAQAQEAGGAMLRELDQCRRQLGVRRPIALRLSPNATSPAVCGLVRPVILVPQNLASRLHGADLQAVLFHELAHVKRGDLWVNLVQTLLQIVYFYNPLLWLANALIRRVREKAVDETVLVALGDAAPQYPETLVNVAKLAFRRPALSLRLIGVVESKSALTGRIKHILNRPFPKTAKLGLLGLSVIFLVAAVLLPMAKGSALGGWFGGGVFARFRSDDKPNGDHHITGKTETYSKAYTLSLRRGEKLAIIAELYQVGRPMRTLGCKVFSDSGGPQRLSVMMERRHLDDRDTAFEHAIQVTVGGESLQVKEAAVNTTETCNNPLFGFFQGSEIAAKKRDGKPCIELAELLFLEACPNGGKPRAPRVWIPGRDPVSWFESDAYFILIRMLPLSQVDYVRIDSPIPDKTQLPDGMYLSDDAPRERRQAVVDEYVLNLKRCLMREHMPVKKLLAHKYYRLGEPIWLYLQSTAGSRWKPNLDEIYRDPDDSPWIFVIDGKEYGCRQGFGLFDGGGGALEIFDNLYFRPGTFRLPIGKHTVAYAWKNVDVVDPNDPDHPVHFARLATDPVEFEILEQLPADYYRPVYQEGWEDILRASIETSFTDDWHKGFAGALLGLSVKGLPFDTAFAVYIQAEGSNQEYRSGDLARVAGLVHTSMACDFGVKELNWDTVGDKRWRIILRPSVEVAKKYPPIREFYAKEFVTDWLSFDRSPQFELNRQAEEQRKGGPQHYGGTIRADRPTDLDILARRWGGQGEAWPLPAGFELGWSPANGGTLRIDSNSGVRLLWLPEANARLVRVTAESRQRLAELPQSRTTEIVPPKGEPTLMAVLSSEHKVYFVTVTKVNETWANLDWFEDQEATKDLMTASSSSPEPNTAPEPRPPQTDSPTVTDNSRDSDGDGLSDFDEIHKYLTDPVKKDSDGDGTPDGDWNERREYTYSVRTVMRYMPPFHEEGLNDDFQDGRVLKRTDDYIEIEVIHYPFATGQESIPENRNWRRDDAQMTEYLAPGPSTNWDQAMRRDLLAALKADGIDVDMLTDKQVVERVSRWLLDRSRYLDQAFTTWFVHFPQGKATVYPGLEEAFRRDFERDSSNYNWTLDQHLDHEVLGKGMFYNKTHGSCTSTAVYLTTALRALGIPTRMILAAPAVDASDPEQIPLVKKAITHHRVRMTMLPALNRASHGTTNHIFNEVYVGNHWCRLDYSQLGCSNFGLHRFGLQTHLYTFNDLSDANLAPTWGRRYAKGEHNDIFRHSNPYTAMEVSELFGPHGQVPNPPFTAQQLDSHPQPDVFLLSPARAGNVWDGFVETVKGWAANKTGRYQQRDSYENLFDGTWLVRPQDVVILLFSLDTPERVPEGYEDLLPKPWPEMEAQLKQGQTVEFRGKARGLNVIVLAAPTADGLKPLLRNSTLLRAMGGSGPSPASDPTASPGAGATQTRVLPQSAAEPVRLAHDVTIELLGVCGHPSTGQQWWRPDGSPRETAPYQTGAGHMSHEDGCEEYELALQMIAPPGTSLMWQVPGTGRNSSTNQPSITEGEYLRTIHSDITSQRAGTETANVSVSLAGGPWQTMATHEAPDHEGSYPLADDKAVALGVAYEKDGITHVPITTNVPYQQTDWRVVAVDREGNLHAGDGTTSRSGSILVSGTTRLRVPLKQVKALLFQTRPWTWVTYRDVSLRPGRRTNVTVEVQGDQPAKAKTATVPNRRAPGQEKVAGIGPAWQILKEAVGSRYGGTISFYGTSAAQRKQFFDELVLRLDPGDAFVLMLAFDRPVGVPPEDADLLPLPWSEIESRVRRGELVEAQGNARGLTVIVLAAPTTAQLDTLVRRTHLLDPFRADKPATAPAGPTQSETTGEAGVRSSPPLAQLLNGVTVELVGVCQYPSTGRPWWRPDGSPLPEPPYDGIGGTISPEEKGAQFEFALRLRNLPAGSDTGMCVEDGSSSNGIPSAKTGARLEDWRWLAATVRADRDTCTVKCGVATEPWRTVARTSGTSPVTRTWGQGSVMFGEARPGPPRGARLSVADDLVEYACNIVAVLPDGTVETPSETQSNSAGKARHTTVSFSHAPAEIQEYRFQIRSWTWVEFENVSLRPGQKTAVVVKAPAAVPSGQTLARLPNSVTVELLGAGAYGSDGQPWWRPDGSPLPEAPYDGITNGSATSDDRTKAPFWLAFRVRNLPESWEASARGSGGQSMTAGNRPGKAGQPQEDLRWLLVEAEPNQTTCTVGCDVMGLWQTVRGTPQDIAARRNDVLTGIRELGTALVAVEVRVRFPPYGWRVLAVTTDGQVREQSAPGGYPSDHTGSTTVYFPGLSLARIREILVQTRPVMRVEFENVPLRPGLKTEVRVRVRPDEADLQGAPSAGTNQEKEIVLPEADRQRVILDLATGELVPLPPVGREPEKLEQALRKLGKGDLLYDCDSGDRTLILMRGATSEQAQGNMGEPFWKSYLIGPSPPATLTVKTAEGRQYRITIRAADDKACTLKYSSASTGKGAGGGALAAPGKTGSPLELRIAPTHDELSGDAVEQRWGAFLAGRMPADGRYLWVAVRPGTNLGPQVITRMHEGTTWLLVHNEEPFIMVPSQGWRLTQARRATDNSTGKPYVTLEFDEAGADRLAQLTQAHRGRPLVALVYGLALFAARIPEEGPPIRSPVIVGNFTKREIDEMIASLRSVPRRPGLKPDARVQVLPAGAGEFGELSVTFSGLWISWQRPEFTIRGDGSVVFSMNRGPRDATRYETEFRLRGEHLEQLTGLLRATAWLTAPGADKDPGYIDATRLDIRLTRRGASRSVACDHRNPEPYLSLMHFLQRLQRQEYLLSRIVVGEAQERLSAFRELDGELRAAEGQPVAASEIVVLDYDRFVPACLDVINHTNENHHDIITTALKLLAWRQVEQARQKIAELATAAQTGLGEVGPTVRTEYIGSAAVQALAALGGEQARARIRAMAKDHQRWPWGVNNALVEAVLAFEGASGAGLLRDMLVSTQNAGWGLIRLGPQGVPAIVGLLQERPAPPNLERIDQIDVIRQYIDHWQEVPQPVDPRVLEAVCENLDYRLGRSPAWTQYHRQLLQLAGVPQPRSQSPTQVAGAFLQAVTSGDGASIDMLATPSSTDWPGRLNQLKQLPSLRGLQVGAAYVDRPDNSALIIASGSKLPEGPGPQVALYLNFISGAVWRVGTITIQTAEQTQRTVQQFRQSHPNAVTEPNDDPSISTAAAGSPASPMSTSIPSDQGAGGGTLAGSEEAVGSLELRIAPRRGELGPDAVEEYTKALAEGRSLADSRCLWVPVRPGMNLPPDLVTQMHQGRTRLLVYNDNSLIMVPSQGWRLVHVGRNADENGRPMLVLRFDQTGANQMARLTRSHGGQLLAIIIGGVVVSTPTIPERQEGIHCATITGAFTEQALADMTTTLRRGTAEQSASISGDFRPITLRNGVTVELLGVCEHPSVGKQWWRPDGNPLTERPYDDDDGRAFPKPGEKGYKLAIRFSGLAGKDVDAYAMPSDCQSTNGGTLAQISRKNGRKNAQYRDGLPDEEIVWQGVAFDQELDSFDLRVGVSRGPWQGEYRQETGKSTEAVEWTIFKDVSLRPQRRNEADKGAGGGALAAPGEDGDVLGFRIAPTPEEVGSEVVPKYKQALAQGERLPGSDFVWLEVRPGTTLVPEQITCEHAGKTWLLVWNEKSHIMLADGSWGLEDVRETTDAMGRRAIGVTLDEKGVELLHDLARANLRHTLAVVLEDRVIAVPFISGPLSGRGLEINGRFTPEEIRQIMAALKKGMTTPREISGRVVDPNGRPVAGAQVALCTKDKGVIIEEGQLVPTKAGGRTSEIVDTDAQGRFAFSSRPEEFHLVAAHERGFVWVTDKELAAAADLRLAPWARIDGTLRIGRELGVDERVSLLNFINKNAIDQGVHFEYRVQTDAAGRFSFERVPPTWMEVGYMIRVGDSIWTDTSRTPIRLQPGQRLKMTLGGEGRPVVGRFVPPADYQGPVYFGAGLRAFATQRPDLPRPADYDRMTQRERQEWLKQWSRTPEAETFYDARWHDLNRRHYSFRIEKDGSFRIEDVIPGKYKFTVWLEERFSGEGRPEEIGSYYGTMEVPPIPAGRTDEPLDLGNLTVAMRSPPLHVGDMAPLFEAQSLTGQDIRLIDYRGKFVLLSFWQPTFHPELDRLKELYKTYGATGRLAILDFSRFDTLAEVQSYIREHDIEWPEIYLGEGKDNEIAKRYGDPVASYILLVNPDGKIIATWLRGEKLTDTVRDALKSVPAPAPRVRSGVSG